jgi:osmoprotectant transport system permease protein
MPPLVGWAVAAEDDPRNPWFSWEYVRQNIDTLMTALQQHVNLTLAAVALSTLIGIPLAVLAFKVRWLTATVLSLSSILYTIPSLALFALLIAATGLGFDTALIGVTIYGLLAIVRNALIGLRQVPPDAREAAVGMGYGAFGLLWRVELPLALPSILTGIRIATVSTVALVTVGAVVSYGGFGTVILNGFSSNFYKPPIMTGTIACLLLAFAFDLLLLGTGKLVMPWTRRRRAA